MFCRLDTGQSTKERAALVGSNFRPGSPPNSTGSTTVAGVKLSRWSRTVPARTDLPAEATWVPTAPVSRQVAARRRDVRRMDVLAAGGEGCPREARTRFDIQRASPAPDADVS